MGSIQVIRSGAMQAGSTSQGGTRDLARVDEHVSVSKVRNKPATNTGWHHHGDHTAYAYVTEGQVRVEWGPGGRESVDLAVGDFYVVPPNTVHREGNPGSGDNCLVGFLAGSGLPVVNVEGPQPA